MIFVGCLCATFVRFSKSIPLLESLQSISFISSHLLTSYFGGKSFTHQYYSLWWVSQVSHAPHNCRKCRILFTSVANVVQAYCHNNDTKEALKTSHTLDLEEGKWLTEVKELLSWEDLLNKGFEGECSPTSALGALVLPYKISGSIITPICPSEGALSILGALAPPSSCLGSTIALWCPFWRSTI